MKEIRLGIIGLGIRSRHVAMHIAKQAKALELAHLSVTAVADPRPKEELIAFAAENGYNVDVSKSEFFTSADDMLNTADIDACLIGTRCNLHTEMAVKVLNRNIDLFLEKPVSTDLESLYKLRDAGEKSNSKVVVSFPLRVTPQVTEAKRIIDSGEIGDIIFANGWTRVAYGGTYYHDWYRDENVTGGLFLQKSTHDFDYINYLVGKKPVEICAMKSKMVMKGDKPAGLFCRDCPENPICPEGIIKRRELFGCAEDSSMCCYAVDTGNEDSGSALLRYEDGTHLSYSQAFFFRNAASCARGVFLGGTKGSLTFDFTSPKITVARTYDRTVTELTISGDGAHFGGDSRLTENFVKTVLGIEPSHSPLSEGIMSALICIKARESANNASFEKIGF